MGNRASKSWTWRHVIMTNVALVVIAGIFFSVFATVLSPQKAKAYDPRPIYAAEWLNSGAIKAYLHNNYTQFPGIATTYVLNNTSPTSSGRVFAEPDAPNCFDGVGNQPLSYIQVEDNGNLTQYTYNVNNKDAAGNINCTPSNLIQNFITEVIHPERRHQWFYQKDADNVLLYDSTVTFKKAAIQPVGGATLYYREGDPLASASVPCTDALVKDGNDWFLFPMNTPGFNGPPTNAYPPAAGSGSEDYQHYTNNNLSLSACRVAPSEMITVFHLGQAANKERRGLGSFFDDAECTDISGLPRYIEQIDVGGPDDVDINEYAFRCIDAVPLDELEVGVRQNGLLAFNGADFTINGYDNSYKLVAGVSDVTPDFTPNPPPVDTGDTAKANEPTCATRSGALGWLICPVIDSAAEAGQALAGFIVNQLKLDTCHIFNDASDCARTGETGSGTSPAYHAAWAAFRNLGFALLIIFGLIMIISQVLNLEIFSAYFIRKMLPGLIIATIFAALSWDIMNFVYNLSNDAADAIMDIIRLPFVNTLGPNFDTVGVVKGILQSLGLVTAGAAAVGAAALYIAIGGPTVVLALMGSLALFLLSVFVLLAARNVVATLLVIFAAPAIILAAFEPTKKGFSFWRGLVVVIVITVPGVGAILTVTNVAALVAASVGGAFSFFSSFIILIAGFAMVWTLFLQMDKVTGFLGNVANKFTGRAQKALSDYRGKTLSRRYGEVKSGERQLGLGMEKMGVGTGIRVASLMGRPGQEVAFNPFTAEGRAKGKENWKRLREAESFMTGDAARKMIERDRGRTTGGDDNMAIAQSAESAEDYDEQYVERERQKHIRKYAEGARKRHIDSYVDGQRAAHIAANGGDPGSWTKDMEANARLAGAGTWTSAMDSSARDVGVREWTAAGANGRSLAQDALGMAQMTRRQIEASMGEIGSKTLKQAAFIARRTSATAYNDYDLKTPEGVLAMREEMAREDAEAVDSGMFTAIEIAAINKENKTRVDISGESYPRMLGHINESVERYRAHKKAKKEGGRATIRVRRMNQTTGQPERDAAGRIIYEERVPVLDTTTGLPMRDRGGNIIFEELGTSTIQTSAGLQERLLSDEEHEAIARGVSEYTTAGAKVAGRTEAIMVESQYATRRLVRTVQETQARIAVVRPEVQAAEGVVSTTQTELRSARDSLALVMADTTADQPQREAAQARVRTAEQEASRAQGVYTTAQRKLDDAQREVIRQMAAISAEQQVMASYATPENSRTYDEMMLAQPMPGTDPPITRAAYIEQLRQTSDVFAEYERTYRQSMAASAQAELANQQLGNPANPAGPPPGMPHP